MIRADVRENGLGETLKDRIQVGGDYGREQ